MEEYRGEEKNIQKSQKYIEGQRKSIDDYVKDK